MTLYMISFEDGAMTFPEEALPAVGEAAHGVCFDAIDADVWVFGGGLLDHRGALTVATDGTVTDGTVAGKQYLGGFAIVDVPAREDALQWAAKFAVACRCAQEVREFMSDPDLNRKHSARKEEPAVT